MKNAVISTTAFERPNEGRAKSAGNKSFFGYFFFKKSNFFLPFSKAVFS